MGAGRVALGGVGDGLVSRVRATITPPLLPPGSARVIQPARGPSPSGVSRLYGRTHMSLSDRDVTMPRYVPETLRLGTDL